MSSSNHSNNKRGGKKEATSPRETASLVGVSPPRRILFEGEDLTPEPLGVRTPGTFEDKSTESKNTSTTTETKVSTGTETAATALVAEKMQKTGLTEDELNEEIEIRLTETSTINLFTQSSLCVHNESSLQRNVEERNRSYRTMKEKKVANPDAWSQGEAQTYNRPMKNKECVTRLISTRATACSATSWDIYDSMVSSKSDASSDQTSRSTSTTCKASRVIYATPGCILPTGNESELSICDNESKSGEEIVRSMEEKEILCSPSLRRALNIAERAVQQNVYHKRHLQYRGLPAVERMSDVLRRTYGLNEKRGDVVVDDDTNEKSVAPASETEQQEDEKDNEESSEETANETRDAFVANDDSATEVSSSDGPSAENQTQRPALQLFWQFHSKESAGRDVTCLDWNSRNRDVLAVGYSARRVERADLSSSEDRSIVCFWTMKNPDHPERVLRFDVDVTSLSFSRKRPFLLAVGLANGSVSIFDVRSSNDRPMLSCDTGSPFKHSQAVWQIQWVDRGSEKGGEMLVSISSDGKVKEWSMKQGLQSSILMSLHRVPRTTEGNFQWKPIDSKGEGIISRQGNGLCFDFAADNSHHYFCGMSDGNVHACSCSYKEQYLKTSFDGHQRSVLRLRCHPTRAGLFLTCSADWTVKLWDASAISSKSNKKSLYTFRQTNLNDAVNDVAWSPRRETMFASVAADGRIEIWDLESSTVEPAITHFTPEKSRLSCLSFAHGSSIISVGDNRGNVYIYDVPNSDSNDGGLRKAIEASLARSS